MTDLHWIVPVARWAAVPAATKAATGLEFVDPMLRRRLSNLSRMALLAAATCLKDSPISKHSNAAGEGVASATVATERATKGVRVVFASRHGELRRSTDILRTISVGETVSPTAFSLSVMNAMTGVFSIARQDRSASTALSAGPETLGYALLEGYAQYVSDPSAPVLVVYADETADPIFGEIQDEIEGGAVAVLISGDATTRLGCRLRPAAADPVATPIAARDGSFDDAGDDTAATVCATQSAAVLQALSGAAAVWQGASGQWCWSGIDA
ncbi:beta-ketoacyl synthase chain length factor [Robbsia sp. KACC 23696]|uniref:beta-ketoacyl synthase chain length factor n=1 Tax=Robbsia sp. KACC 23696 TaxID=3149231 RepID=UPI00325BAF80